jgi:quinol monooxygenase YgiN
MTCLIARLKVKPGREPDFERLQRDYSSLALEQEPGTLVYDVLRSRTDPGSYVIYVRFRDDASFKAHQTTALRARLIPQIVDTLGDEMDLQFFDWIG